MRRGLREDDLRVLGAAEVLGEQEGLYAIAVGADEHDDALAFALVERGLNGVREALARVRRRDQAVHDHEQLAALGQVDAQLGGVR